MPHDAALSHADLLQKVDRFSEAQILCVGDVMLDRFIYGSVDRISPEAPIPVIKYDHEKVMLGGAGNVIRNISSLGGNAAFISVVGADETGNSIVAITGQQENVEPYLLTEPRRTSTEKTRYIATGQQLFRTDKETNTAISGNTRRNIRDLFEEEIEKYQLVILSDYGKGVLSEDMLAELQAIAKSHSKPVIIDPKSHNFALYEGAFVVTPNLKELAHAADVSTEQLNSHETIADAARTLMTQHRIQNMLVTCSANGMLLVSSDANKPPLHIPAQAREIYDVSGAGDTVIATLAVALASGCPLAEAAIMANAAAGIVVGKIGTADVYRTDLKSALHHQSTRAGTQKIFPQDIARDQIDSWQRSGLKVGFTNGCFDLVHPGHLALMNDARAECDKLVVGINSDASVKRLKGEERPINQEMDRAMLLAELHAVDMVVIFREDTPEELLNKLRPDVLMKGADYELSEIVGAEFVQSYGGNVARIPLREGYSSTNVIERIKQRQN